MRRVWPGRLVYSVFMITAADERPHTDERRNGSTARWRGAILGALAFALLLAPTLVAAEEPGPGAAEDSVPTAGGQVDRPLSRSELQQEIELTLREFEELLARIGDAEPTEAQTRKASELTARLAELRATLK